MLIAERKKFGLNLFNKEINSHEETKRNETKRNETKRLLLSLINNHFKTFLITLLSLTLLFSISCSDAYKPIGEDGTRTLSYYAGNWWGSLSSGSEESIIFTINLDGSVLLIVGGNSTIPSTDITKNSDTSYTYYNTTETENASIHFNFTSDTEGTITLEGDSGTLSVTVTKK